MKKETKEDDFSDIQVSTNDPKVDLLREGKTLIKSEVGYHTAISVQKPRDIDKIVENVLKEAEFGGQEFFYSWPVKLRTGGQKIISGGSIGLAISLAREWTNCAIPVEVSENEDCYIFRAGFVDLEKGFTLMRTYRQRKEQDIGKKYDEQRKQDMIFQIGQSKAIRNVVLNAVPRWLVKKAIDKAKQAVLDHITKEGIDISRNKAISFFSGYGVSEEQLIGFLKKKVNDWTIEDIAQLRSTGQMIKDGEAAVNEIFPPLETGEKKETLTAEEILNDKKGKSKKSGEEKTEPKGEHTELFKKKFREAYMKCYAKDNDIPISKFDGATIKKLDLKIENLLNQLTKKSAQADLDTMLNSLKGK